MVHLTYDLSDAGHHLREVVIGSVQHFVQKEHGYIPWNSFADIGKWDDSIKTPDINLNGQPTDQRVFWDKSPQNALKCHHSNYQHRPQGNDAKGKKKCHIEYGWQEVNEELNPYERKDGITLDKVSIIGHRGNIHAVNENGLPAYPGQVIYTLKIRGITDWSDEEQKALDVYMSNFLTSDPQLSGTSMLYKFPDDYSMEEVAAHQSAIDWAFTEAYCHKQNFQAGKNSKEMWACRICKGAYSRKQGQKHHDFGHNPAPIFTTGQANSGKVCEGCNSLFVLSARVGGNPFKMNYPCAKDECQNPFIYPKKPTSERHGWASAMNSSAGMCFSAGNPKDPEIKWDSKDDADRRTNEVERQDDYLSYLMSKMGQQTEAFFKYANDAGFEFGSHPGQFTSKEKAVATGMIKELWDAVPKKDRLDFIRTMCQDEVEMLTTPALKKTLLKHEAEVAAKLEADLHEQRTEVELQKEEVRATAASARATLARVKEANKPQGQKINALKDEVARLHEIIAGQKELLAIVKHIPEKAKWKMVFAQVRHHPGRLVQGDPEVNNRYGNQFHNKTRYPNEKYVEQWAVDDYREASQRALTAQVARQAQIAKAQRKKKQVKECPCQVCGKMFPEKQLADVWGDLLCRKCAK